MKKLSFCALALTLTALFFSGSALAGDVPSCPMIGWDDAAAAQQWDWKGASGCGVTNGVTEWDSASCGTAASETTQTQSAGTQEPIRCGSCGSTSCDGYCTGTASGNSSCWAAMGQRVRRWKLHLLFRRTRRLRRLLPAARAAGAIRAGLYRTIGFAARDCAVQYDQRGQGEKRRLCPAVG